MLGVETGFDTSKYIDSQVSHIQDRLSSCPDNQIFMEFGGKPFGDYHAARVLPGYDPDCKASILTELLPVCDIAMVVNARDILPPVFGRTLQGRIRGDSGLRYDQETLRLVRQAHDFNLDVTTVVLAIAPTAPNERDKEALDQFQGDLDREGVRMHTHYEIPGYPNPEALQDLQSVFGVNDVVASSSRPFIAFSPGGGSGKFGVLLSEMYHALARGTSPNYIKFETFPLYTEVPEHPLNLAFEAATADLENSVVAVEGSNPDSKQTSYDKDIENFLLLKHLYHTMGVPIPSIDRMANPTDMGVNRIRDGITNISAIVDACREEISRRIVRYKGEVEQGLEKASTLSRTHSIRDKFVQIYG